MDDVPPPLPPAPEGANSATASAVPVQITFDNRGDRLIALGIWNGLLKLITLGIYSSWAKTEVRRRIWSFIRINGEPLEYRGTGRELFVGLLMATMLIILPTILGAIVVAIVFPKSINALTAYQGVLYLVFFMLVGNAIYRAWRYRLSRSNWRGIRGALTGSPAGYSWAYFWTLALPVGAAALGAIVLAWWIGPNVGGLLLLTSLIAALWALPWRANKLRGMMTANARFGDRPLVYDGHAGPLYKAYLVAWIGCAVVFATAVAMTLTLLAGNNGGLVAMPLPTPGTGGDTPAQIWLPPIETASTLIAIWLTALVLAAVLTASYRARKIRHFAGHTHFDGATFRSTVNGRGLLWITLSNWALRFLAVAAALAAALALLHATGMLEGVWPPAPEAISTPEQREVADAIRGLIVIALIVAFTTVANTIAQFRSARYLMSRLTLDGTVDLAAISQSSAAGPKRGEGLAQVFELDAF